MHGESTLLGRCGQPVGNKPGILDVERDTVENGG